MSLINKLTVQIQFFLVLTCSEYAKIQIIKQYLMDQRASLSSTVAELPLSMDCFFDDLSKGFTVIDGLLKKCTLLIGGALQGKSTLYNYLKGEKLIGKRVAGRNSYELRNPLSTQAAKMGSNVKKPCTFIPSIFNMKNESFVDTSCLQNSHSGDKEVIAYFLFQALFKKGKQFRFIYVIKQSQFQKVDIYINLSHFLKLFVKNNTIEAGFRKKLFDSIAIVVNRAEGSIEEQLQRLSQIQFQIEQFKQQIPFYQLVLQLFRNIVNHKRVRVFQTAKNNQQPEAANIIEHLQNAQIQWNFINRQQFKNPNTADLIPITLSLSQKIKVIYQNWDKKFNQSLKIFSILNELFKVMYDNIFEKHVAYQNILLKINEINNTKNRKNQIKQMTFVQTKIPVEGYDLLPIYKTIYSICKNISQNIQLIFTPQYKNQLKNKFYSIINELQKNITMGRIQDCYLQNFKLNLSRQLFQLQLLARMKNYIVLAKQIQFKNEFKTVINQIKQPQIVTMQFIDFFKLQKIKRRFTNRILCIEFDKFIQQSKRIVTQLTHIYQRQYEIKQLISKYYQNQQQIQIAFIYKVECFSAFSNVKAKNSIFLGQQAQKIQKDMFMAIMKFCSILNKPKIALKVAVYVDYPDSVCQLYKQNMQLQQNDRPRYLTLLKQYGEYCFKRGRKEEGKIALQKHLQLVSGTNQEQSTRSALLAMEQINNFVQIWSSEYKRKLKLYIDYLQHPRQLKIQDAQIKDILTQITEVFPTLVLQDKTYQNKTRYVALRANPY